MKAITVRAFGPADQLELVDKEAPRAGCGEVEVLIAAAGVGFVDVMARQGRYLFKEPGFVPGLELAGTVQAVGEEVPADWIGKRVFALSMSGGAYAERIIVSAESLVTLPQSMTFEQAVALGMNATVAVFGVRRLAISGGDEVLIRGASGGIGLMALQLAARSAKSVTATGSSGERAEQLRTLGATSTCSREVRFDDSTFDAILDIVSGPDLKSFFTTLRKNGRYVLCGGAGGAPTDDFGMGLMDNYHKSISFDIFSLNSLSCDKVAGATQAAFDAFERQELKPVIADVLPLTRAAEAHSRLERGGVFGKLILTPV